jgi:integrase
MLFKFAGEEGYCAENVIKRIKRPVLIDKPAEIYSVGQAVLLLMAANQGEKSLIPYLVIGFFAGLRSSELETLDWNEINLHGKKIEVKAEKAKTSRRRFVEMSENLCAWLKPYEKTEGPIVSVGWRDRLQKLFKSAKEPKHEFDFDAWPRNGLRHSYGSYHYAFHQDANKTASQMGHETTKMLFAHYRELVSFEQAEQYWNIFPPENGWLMISPEPKKRKISAKDIQAVNRVMQRLQKTQLTEFQ